VRAGVIGAPLRTLVVPAGMPNAAAIAKKLARAYGIEVCLETI
jgi:hypothetical protein